MTLTDDTLETVDVCKRIAAHLKLRSGKAWSVTKGRGTANNWLNISAPPARRNECGIMVDEDRTELGELLGLPGPVHGQGEVIPGSNAHYREYLARAAGLIPAKIAEAYWD